MENGKKIYKVDGCQSNGGLGKDLAKLLSKITKKSFCFYQSNREQRPKIREKEVVADKVVIK